MIASDGDSWDGFPVASSSRGIDFPAESISAAKLDKTHVPSFFSMDSAIHASEIGAKWKGSK
jgi:hypothetical protein